MKIIKVIRKFLRNMSHSAKMSEEISDKMSELIAIVQQLTLNAEGTLVANQHNAGNVNDGYQGPPTSGMQANARQVRKFDRKTANPNHPDYDAEFVRNFPGVIFNPAEFSDNLVYNQLKPLIQKKNCIPDAQWKRILQDCLVEIETVPHSEQVFERKQFVENYLTDLKEKHQAHYNPGWVNLEDALFLYWVVRQLNPKRIVQTGVCNGLSSAFMMLALAKNGPDGTLHVIDMPPIFDSADPNWTIKNKLYGVVIPEGKSSGWLVPDAYRDRFEVLNGDAKDLLPGLLQKVGSIDMFYHDSDHTYDHMMFEFIEAKKYLTQHGVIVSDDISWNASLWDFADQYMAPAYNYRGSMGIACF